MNRFFICVAAALALVCQGLSANASLPLMEPEEAQTWTEKSFAKGQIPPFSFTYNGKSSDEFILSWKYSKQVLQTGNPDIVQYVFTYIGKKEGLRAECVVDVYKDFDAVKWVVNFTNIGKKNSAQLASLQALDADFKSAGAGAYQLHYLEGSHISKADYHPRSLSFEKDSVLTYIPVGGRSSEEEFPFYNFEAPDHRSGFVMAVGWTGTWKTQMVQNGDNSLGLTMGLNVFDSYLLPGEAVRTPSVCLMFWEGENRMTGHNKFRRYLLEHICRKCGGKYAEYPLSCSFNHRDPYPYTEYSGTNETYAKAMVERYIQFGIQPDLFWLDAGWNTGASRWQDGLSWANTVGNWSVDKTRFPNGLKPISDLCHKVGAKFMVWFEPERVMLNTEWADKHPEYLLEIPNSNENTYRLFDLGNPEAREWMTNEIITLIKDNGIDYYRQDFNMHPDEYWAANDEPGRAGMKEMRHIEGLYAFWDELLETFPELIIDNCASGGRRLDLEMTSRGAPLWRSDYYHYDDPSGYQGHTVGLNFFLPIHGTGILLDDEYSFRSSMSSTLVINWKNTLKENNILRMQKNIENYRIVKPYYYEDFYPLCNMDDLTSEKIWVSYQMHRPSDDSSVVLAFRRSEAAEAEHVVQLQGLNPEKVYTVSSFDGLPDVKLTGKELNEGFIIHLDSPKSSAMFMIK